MKRPNETARDQTPSESTTPQSDDASTLVPQSDSWGRASDAVSKPKKIGRYTIVQELGRGGQGVVYRAIHPSLPIDLAIKISAQPLYPDYQKALRAEAQILCDLDHPNIARVRDLDFHLGRPFLVLDFIHGRSLRERFDGGELSKEQAVDWLATAARAIDFAHRRGTVHLDLKPDNIIVDENDDPKIIDFGLARVRGAWRATASEKDRVSGTLQYMSPEQAVGKTKRIGSHSDVFALGAVLYHILTGKPPFEGRKVQRLLEKIRNCEFDRNSLENSDASSGLKQACLKAMSKHPRDRFGSAAAFAEAITPSYKKRSPSLRQIVGSCAILCVLALAVATAFAHRRNGSAPPERNAGLGVLGASERLVQKFEITHIGRDNELSGPLFTGRPTMEDDNLRITVEFLRPSYCFLIALNPNGAIQLCYPNSPLDVPPGPVASLGFPSDRKLAFGLTDGAGNQAFILVTSENPLPPFQQWKDSLPVISWPQEKITGNWCYSDGVLIPQNFEHNLDGSPRARGDIRPLQQPPALQSVIAAFESSAGIGIEGIVFEVARRQ